MRNGEHRWPSPRGPRLAVPGPLRRRLRPPRGPEGARLRDPRAVPGERRRGPRRPLRRAPRPGAGRGRGGGYPRASRRGRGRLPGAVRPERARRPRHPAGGGGRAALFARVLLDARSTGHGTTTSPRSSSRRSSSSGRQESVRPLERYLVRTRPWPVPPRRRSSRSGDRRRTAALLKLARPGAPERPARARPGARRAPLARRGEEAPPARGRSRTRPPPGGPVRPRQRRRGRGRARPRDGARRRLAPRARAGPPLYLLHARRLVESGPDRRGRGGGPGVLETIEAPASRSTPPRPWPSSSRPSARAALPEVLAAADEPRPGLPRLGPRPGREGPGERGDRALGREGPGRGPRDRGPGSSTCWAGAGTPRRCPSSGRACAPGTRRCAAPPSRRRRGSGATAVLPDLLARLHVAGEDEVPGLETALVGFPAARVVPGGRPAPRPDPAPREGRPRPVLGAKGAREKIERLFALAEDPSRPSRAAAFVALGRLAGEADLPRLAAAAGGGPARGQAPRLREAIGASIRRNPDVERRADGLLALLKPPRRPARSPSSGPAGGRRSEGPARGGRRDREPGRRGALRRGRRPGPLAGARGGGRAPAHREGDPLEGRVRALALQGYLRLVGPVNMPGPQARAVRGPARPARGRRGPRAGARRGRRRPRARVAAAPRAAPRPPGPARGRRLGPAGPSLPAVRPRALAVRPRGALGPAAGRGVLSDPAVAGARREIVRERLRRAASYPSSTGARSTGGRASLRTRRRKMAAGARPPRPQPTRRCGPTGGSWTEPSPSTGRREPLHRDDYADFELLVDWKIGKGGDSGILPPRRAAGADLGRRGPTRRARAASSTTRGPTVPPSAKADRPVGEWNRLRIFMIGERVTVYLNDRRVVDNPSSRTTGSGGADLPAGPIEPRRTATRSWFRHVFVREIPRDEGVPAVTEVEVAEGFVPSSTDATSRAGRGAAGATPPRAGRSSSTPSAGGGTCTLTRGVRGLRPPLRLQADSGRQQRPRHPRPARGRRGLRGDGDPDPRGRLAGLLGPEPYQYHGSVYGVVPARRGALRPVGEWNSEEVTVKGRKRHRGRQRDDRGGRRPRRGERGRHDRRPDHPGLKRASGHVGFLGHGSALELRNIRIRELP
jgi:hypothetical protein